MVNKSVVTVPETSSPLLLLKETNWLLCFTIAKSPLTLTAPNTSMSAVPPTATKSPFEPAIVKLTSSALSLDVWTSNAVPIASSLSTL